MCCLVWWPKRVIPLAIVNWKIVYIGSLQWKSTIATIGMIGQAGASPLSRSAGDCDISETWSSDNSDSSDIT